MAFNKLERRTRRQSRIRMKVSGIPERPRISVYKSNKHFYAQIIDDVNGKTLAFASSSDKTLKGKEKKKPKDMAGQVGIILAEKATKLGIKKAVFDRNGFAYHGCIKSFADAAREKGLVF